MRLPNDRSRRLARRAGLTALLAAALGGCAAFGGGGEGLATSGAASAVAAGVGPSADYPVVVGEPYRIGSKLYTPADTLNYDETGYLAADSGTGITGAHHTLPLPSYAEVTSLETGRTILVRLERRGPMSGDALVGLSPAALAQLAASPAVAGTAANDGVTRCGVAKLLPPRSEPRRHAIRMKNMAIER